MLLPSISCLNTSKSAKVKKGTLKCLYHENKNRILSLTKSTSLVLTLQYKLQNIKDINNIDFVLYLQHFFQWQSVTQIS